MNPNMKVPYRNREVELPPEFRNLAWRLDKLTRKGTGFIATYCGINDRFDKLESDLDEKLANAKEARARDEKAKLLRAQGMVTRVNDYGRRIQQIEGELASARNMRGTTLVHLVVGQAYFIGGFGHRFLNTKPLVTRRRNVLYDLMKVDASGASEMEKAREAVRKEFEKMKGDEAFKTMEDWDKPSQSNDKPPSGKK